jgi:hypothetical protein
MESYRNNFVKTENSEEGNNYASPQTYNNLTAENIKAI